MNKSHISRIVDIELNELSQLPAVAIEGSKGVGKTETALRRVNTIYKLEARAL